MLGLALLAAPVAPAERGVELVEVAAPARERGGDEAEASAAGEGAERGREGARAAEGGGSRWSAGDDAGLDFDFDALESGSRDRSDREGSKGQAKGQREGPAEAAGEAGASAARKRWKRVGEVLGGSLRLTGAYLHHDDEAAALFPDGDDALGLVVGRILARGGIGEHVRYDVNGFVELARSPGSLLGGAFASAGSTESAYRTRFLGWRFWEDGAVRGSLGLDRAVMSVLAGPFKLDVGRMPVNYSVTNVFQPNDFYAPFAATAVNRIYKPGVDGVRASVAVGPLATIDVVGVLGYGDEDAPTWGRSSILARAGAVGGGFEWGLLGGKVAERWVAGGSAQGDAGPIGLRAEFHVGVPDRDGRGHGGDDLPIYARAAGGPSVSFAWRSTTLGAEYMLISDGATAASGYLARAGALYPDTVPYLARHYVAALFGTDVVPILRASALAMVNASDGSGLAGVSAVYNVADESDLIVGVFAPWGRGLQGMVTPGSPLPLGSEYGLSPLVVYLESRVFF